MLAEFNNRSREIPLQKVGNIMKKSWKTTACGILVAVGILIAQAVAILDNDPETSWSLAEVGGALAAFGFGYFARDNKVSSEDVGVK